MVEVKLTLSPTQIAPEGAALIAIVGVTIGFTVIVIPALVTGPV